MEVSSQDSPEGVAPPSAELLSCHVTRTVFPGVVCVEVSVEADLLVAGSDGGRMAVWNLADRQLIHLLLGHTGEVT